MKFLKTRIAKSTLSLVALLLVTAPSAFALTQATTGAGQDLYTFVVTDLLGGPIGIVVGILAVGMGLVAMIGRGNFVLAVPALIGGVALLKLDSIVTSFGAMLG